MPFTTSHPAIVLPLKKIWPRWFSLSGLMAGAMAPDLQYFLIADTTFRGDSHSWLGLFQLCLPLGLLFVFAFHWLFKQPFIVNLPRPLANALSGLAASKFTPTNTRGWIVLVYSVILGTLSHFFWDSFTHASGEIAQQIGWLTDQSTLFGLVRQNTRWMQHASTLLGAAGVLVGIWFWKLLPPPLEKPTSRTVRQKLIFWSLGSICGLLFAVAAALFHSDQYGWPIELGYNLTLPFMSFGLGSWAGFFWFVCGYSLWRRRPD